MCFLLQKPLLVTETFSPGARLATKQVKNLPAMQEPQETRSRALRREDALEEGLATHSSVLACRIPWRAEPGGLWSTGAAKSQMRLEPRAGTHGPFSTDVLSPPI